MKIEQAIRLLHPDTTSEEIAEIEYKNGFRDEQAAVNKINEACEIACKAMEKQIPKRPKIKKFDKVNGFDLRCPNDDCGAVLQSDSPCCRYCGQALDWSDT